MTRSDWAGLPETVRAAVESHTGPVTAVAPIADGLTCSMAAALTTASGRVFVKGVPVGDVAVAMQDQEVAVNPLVLAAGPRLVWRVAAGGWDVLGFDYVPGRHADLSRPEGRRLVGEALAAVQRVPAPSGLPQLATRFAGFLDPGQFDLLRGDALLHTDTNPHNLLVGDGRAWIVDWAMPAAGPAWVDVALTAVRLLEADCSADVALGWAAGFPSWREADPRAVWALVEGSCRSWERVVGCDRAVSSNRRFRTLLARTGVL